MSPATSRPVVGRRLPERIKIRLLQALMHIVPVGRHAVVAGAPDDEGNSVEVVRALAGLRKVYWLVNDDPANLAWMVTDAVAAKDLHFLRKNSLRAFAAYVTARHVFFTHGLYGSPRPPRHKVVVNLWHGDGPKRRKGFAEIRSTYVVSGTELWGLPRARTFDVADNAVLVTGNPRIDQFARPATGETLSALGLDPDRPLVLWMPTYRTTDFRYRRLGAVRNWSDGGKLSGAANVRDLLVQVAAAATRRGVTLVVKPHALDADTFADTGIACLTGADLIASRVTLYQMLGRADGLITDYSSVWTDFLARDRPIGFFCPDLEEYASARGLNVPDYPALVPGPFLECEADFEAFFRECTGELDATQEQRRRSVTLIGAETRAGATDRLLRRLGIHPLTDATSASAGTGTAR